MIIDYETLNNIHTDYLELVKKDAVCHLSELDIRRDIKTYTLWSEILFWCKIILNQRENG